MCTAMHILDIPGWFLSLDRTVPAHRARDTVAFLERKVLHSSINVADEFKGFLTESTMYSICTCSVGLLQEKAYPSRIVNMDELKTRRYRRVETLSPVDHGCCYLQVSQRLCPRERDTIRAPVPTSI